MASMERSRKSTLKSIIPRSCGDWQGTCLIICTILINRRTICITSCMSGCRRKRRTKRPASILRICRKRRRYGKSLMRRFYVKSYTSRSKEDKNESVERSGKSGRRLLQVVVCWAFDCRDFRNEHHRANRNRHLRQ